MDAFRPETTGRSENPEILCTPDIPERRINGERGKTRHQLHWLLRSRDDAEEFLIRNRPALRRTFGIPTSITCMDEGCLPQTDAEYSIYLAGAGNLHPHQQELADQLRASGVRRVEPHVDCAANAKYVQINKLPVDSELIGEMWAREFVRNLDDASIEPIDAERLHREVGTHPARLTYLLGGERGFDPRKAELPLGFKVSRGYAPRLFSNFQAGLTGTIASGKMQPGETFRFVALGDGKDYPAEMLLDELKPVMRELRHQHRAHLFDAVGIDVVTAR